MAFSCWCLLERLVLGEFLPFDEYLAAISLAESSLDVRLLEGVVRCIGLTLGFAVVEHLGGCIPETGNVGGCGRRRDGIIVILE